MARRGVVGGILGGVVAAGTAGAVAVAAQQRRTVGRVRTQAEDAGAYPSLPVDRSGTVTSTDGVPLVYEEVGPADAPLTVVFCHGFCLSMAEWWFQRRDLAERFGDGIRMVFWDQRSHGRSGRSDPSEVTIDQLGRDLASVLADRAPGGPLVLIGHSMGGMTIMALADRDPGLFTTGRVRGVGFVATSAGNLSRFTMGLPGFLSRFETPVLLTALKLAGKQVNLVERGRRLGADLAWSITQRLSFVDPAIEPATVKYVNDMIAATRVDVVANFFPTILEHDKASALVHLRETDVEIVVGDHDLLLPLAHSRAIAAALPDARLTVVEQAGHIVVLERPQVVDEILGGLIARAATDVPARAAG